MKTILLILTVLLLPTVSYGQTGDVVLLEKTLPIIQSGIGLAGYLNAIYQIGLGVATVLAVIMIIWGGLEYMTKDSLQKKSDGKNRITQALIGLLLAYGSWLILYTLNPDLVSFRFLERLESGSSQSIGEGDTTSAGTPWRDDKNIRDQLAVAGITFNNPNCTTIGQSGCTSIAGFAGVNQLIQLKENCCSSLEVTGGTEYWLHGARRLDMSAANTNHKPGGTTVDLRPGGDLNEYLTGSRDNPGSGCGSTQQKDGFRYTWEGPGCGGSTGAHWHITF